MSIRTVAVGLAILASACAGSGSPDINDAGDPPSDGNNGCQASITFDPADPIASADTPVRAIGHVDNAPGVQTYTWHVFRGTTEIPFQPEQGDFSQISFPSPTPASFTVYLKVTVPGSLFCPEASGVVTSIVPGANDIEMRLHVVPPAGEAGLPIDQRVIVKGSGPTTLPDIVLDSGIIVTGSVNDGATGIPAYLRFLPRSKEAFVESFSDGTGAFSARVPNLSHDVLVIPTAAGFAPQLIKNWMPQSDLVIVSGLAISGVVRDPANAVLVGAKVQLTIDGVPSTLATTNTLGAFTIRAVPGAAGSTVRFDVSPPATAGLPRLAASSTTFDLAQPVTVRYAASLSTRDLAGTTVRRAGAALAGAKVSLVGTLPLVGTVTAGVSANATGEVRLTASTDGTGALPTLRAPATALTAVVEPAPGDLAVTAIDLSTGVPSSINAAAMQAVNTVVHSPASGLLEGVTLDAIPLGALQLAGANAIRATSNASGAITTSLAAGGHYELRFSDPGGNGAQLVVPDVTAPAVAASQTLLGAVQVNATIRNSGGLVSTAAVQLLCSACTGLVRSRPVAEGTSGIDGKFSLAVPDPGTN
ncbi:MAG: hypothetical protein H6Q90_4567 [Deltaproteobacteria bacterium]|nr:hypothetical protein [Deltaproteobacteria bacterium]